MIEDTLLGPTIPALTCTVNGAEQEPSIMDQVTMRCPRAPRCVRPPFDCGRFVCSQEGTFRRIAEHRRGIAPMMGPYLWSALAARSRSPCLHVTCHVPN